MKKIVWLTLTAFCLSGTLAAQSTDDDLYFVPSKNKKTTATERQTTPARQTVIVESDSPATVYSSQGNTTVVVRNRAGEVRDVDEYNRRYEASDNRFSVSNDTLYIDEREYDGLDGEWVNGFDGSADDYEYATRIIRFRNPRYAISISSPFYWDVVYGLNSWEWNVYTDGLYAYAFPTFSNRLWWDWRYNSYGWGSYPYYSWNWYGPGWYYGWYGGPYWGHHHHFHYGWCGPHWGGGHWNNHYAWNRTYTSRRSYGDFGFGGTSSRRSAGITGNPQNRVQSANGTRRTTTGVRTSTNATRRVVGTRATGTDGTRRTTTGVRSTTTGNRQTGVRTQDAASSRRTTYTRPSSTRSGSSVQGVRSTVRTERTVTGSSQRSQSTYTRGSSNSNGSRSTMTQTRQQNNSYNNGNRSYSGSNRSSSSFSTGSSTRSSGGGYSGGGASRSSGGGSSRGSRR